MNWKYYTVIQYEKMQPNITKESRIYGYQQK